jgi:perosamine synthetase
MSAIMSVDRFIPWAEPAIWGNEESYVVDALRSTWISGGPYVERLERELATFLGVRHALAVANGTAALHLAYLAIGLSPGDEVIVPGFGFMAAANVALLMNAKPAFVDVDPETWCMRAENARSAITAKTRAIVAVHSYGNMCAMDNLVRLSADHGLALIEDAAEALGSRALGRQAGSIGRIGTYSFHATKTLTTGEGGMVVTDDDTLAERMRLYRSHGLRRARHYWHEVPGHNFRLTNMQAALGCAQFEHFRDITAARRRVYATYTRLLAGLEGVRLQSMTSGTDPIVWAVAIALDPASYPQGRDRVIETLYRAGIETRPGFQPPSEMSYFSHGPLPTSDCLGKWVLSLPSSPTLTEEGLGRICKTLADLRGVGG